MKTFDFFIERTKMQIKYIIEYKINFYSMFFSELGNAFSYILILLSLDTLNLIPEWTLEDYILFVLLSQISLYIYGAFFWGGSIKNYLKSGKMNNFLIRPINVIYQQYFNLNIFGLLGLTLNIMYLFVFKYYFGLSYNVIFIGIPLAIIATIPMFVINFFANSIYFWNYGIPEIFYIFFGRIRYTSRTYPPTIFSGTNFKYVFMFFPAFYVSFITIPIINGQFPENFWFYNILIFGISAILFIISIINWHYGIKRYEGFN